MSDDRSDARKGRATDDEMIDGLMAEVERMREGIGKAASALDTAGRSPEHAQRAASEAAQWLRTTYPLNHPNYLRPSDITERDA